MGLRLNAEYYKIEQFDAVTQPSLQVVVDNEAILPGRVTRNSSGVITLVDVSFVNLYHLETEGWDLSADYSLKTGAGRFSLHAVESIMLHLKTQFSKTLPEYDAAGFAPTENGGPKHKSNVTLTWDWRKWTAGWTTRYFGSYKQFGAAGGPSSLQFTNGAVDRRARDYVGAQGSDTVDSQMYHDLFVGYAFGKTAYESRTWGAAGSKLMDGLTVQFGLRNVFNKAAPLDVAYLDTNYALSPFGDIRLRTYWLALKKSF